MSGETYNIIDYNSPQLCSGEDVRFMLMGSEKTK